MRLTTVGEESMFTHLWFSMTDVYLLTGRWPQKKRRKTKHIQSKISYSSIRPSLKYSYSTNIVKNNAGLNVFERH